MKLSIITINYNNCEGLRKTIDSVVAQTWQEFEWIIVDGGSNDGSRELIEKTAARLQSEGWPVEHFSLLGFTAEDWKAYPSSPEGKENVDSVSNVKVLKWCSEPDKGIYNAMNKGIVKALGEYCLFLNSGDWLYSYDVLDKVIASNFSSDFVVGCVEYDFGITHPFDESYSLYHLTHHSFPHQGSFIRNSIFEDYGLYNERFKVVSDWEIFIKALVHGLATVEFVETLVAGMERGGISFDNNILKCEHEILKKKYFSIQLYKDLQYSESLSYVVHTSYITKLLYRLLFRFSTLIRLIQKK